ncbi:protein of unknown function [Desulfurobacterium atlanticum]|uniref:Uncharacterized protein n=1 Tax=Desulfurobacterium atlanticum TaxID=240169 RepID=A0A238XW02_9BACT|nr:protein of unknown function [Desulfurobacterium atlanticum]
MISLVASKERTHPYVIGYKMMKDSKITIKLPEDYNLYFLPENFSYKNSVGSINLWWKQLPNGKIEMSFKMKLEKAEIPVKEYGKLRELFNLTVKTLQNQIVILKKVER